MSLSHGEHRMWICALPRFLAEPFQRPSCFPRFNGSESGWGLQESHLYSVQLQLRSQTHTGAKTSGKDISGKHALLNPTVWINWRSASLCQSLVTSQAPSSNVSAFELHFKAKDQSQVGHAALFCCQWALGNSAGVFPPAGPLPHRTSQYAYRWNLNSTESLGFVHLPHSTLPHTPQYTHTVKIF